MGPHKRPVTHPCPATSSEPSQTHPAAAHSPNGRGADHGHCSAQSFWWPAITHESYVVITAAEANLTAAVPGRFIGDARPVIAGSIAPQELTWSLFRRNVCNSFRVNGVGMAPTLWAQ